jgi:hypothetical protein
VSTADAAFPSLDTPAGYTQFLWRNSRAKVVGEHRELQAIGMKPLAEDGELRFSATLLDGTRLAVSVTEEAAQALRKSGVYRRRWQLWFPWSVTRAEWKS